MTWDPDNPRERFSQKTRRAFHRRQKVVVPVAFAFEDPAVGFGELLREFPHVARDVYGLRPKGEHFEVVDPKRIESLDPVKRGMVERLLRPTG